MNFRKITALCTSLIVCASVLAGCGSENEESSEKKTKSTINSSVQETTDDQNTADDQEKTEEETTEEETTTESEEDSELYEYYNLLNEEFEKGNISNRNFNGCGGNFSKYKSKIIFLNNSPIFGGSIENATVFDTETKQSKTFDLNSGYGEGCVIFQNGFFYVITNDNKLAKYDTDGNIVSTGDYGGNLIEIVSPDGAVITQGAFNFDDNSNTYNLISPDFSEEKEIPKPQRDVGHNMTEDVKQYDWISFDGDKAYAYCHIPYSNGDYAIFCLDTKTMEWTQLQTLSAKSWNGSPLYNLHFGKYILQDAGDDGDIIINLETGEEIAQCKYIPTASSNLKGNYSCAGLSHHFRKEDENGDERWYAVRHPGNGDYTDSDKCEPLGIENFQENSANANVIRIIDDTYYAIIDDTGVFLRTYEKGEAEEETICLFEKN